MATDTLTHATAHAHEHGHHDTGPMKVFGFWIYLMSDCILFCCLFATYAVLVNGTAGCLVLALSGWKSMNSIT